MSHYYISLDTMILICSTPPRAGNHTLLRIITMAKELQNIPLRRFVRGGHRAHCCSTAGPSTLTQAPCAWASRLCSTCAPWLSPWILSGGVES
jgi:hypothetical protein